MWKPPQRIRHAQLPAGWPTAEEAARSRWFQPIDVGPVRLAERTWVPAMVPWRATEDGFVTPEVLAWYERFAEGEPGALVVEATGIRDIPSGPLLRVGDDRFVPGLRELVGTVRRAGGGRTKLFLQIIAAASAALKCNKRGDGLSFYIIRSADDRGFGYGLV